MTDRERDEHGRFIETPRKKRSVWGTIVIVLLTIALILFLLTRCDIVHMKWKTHPTPPIYSVQPPIMGTPHPEVTPPMLDVAPTHVPDGQAPDVNKDGVITDDGTIDDRMTDPNATEHDVDLRKGDDGVEATLGVQAHSVMRKLTPPRAVTGSYPVNDVIAFGSKYFGTRYKYGSDRFNDKDFDCSDFTHWIWWKSGGMDIPKDSRSQWDYINKFGSHKEYSLKDAKRGDLLFFMSYRGYKPENYKGVNKATQRITHVGIYLGDGKILHTASAASGGVRIDSMFGKQLEFRFLKGGSVL